MPIGRCRTCKSWSTDFIAKGAPLYGAGECLCGPRVYTPEATAPNSFYICALQPDDICSRAEASTIQIYTGPEFGCVHHTPR